MNVLAPLPAPSVPRTPPVPQPPNDPISLLLNERVGWRAQPSSELVASADERSLVLPLADASKRALTEASGSFGGLRPPGNVAVAPDGSVYLLDASKTVLKRFDPCTCAFETVPAIGGEGGGGREWRSPHGIGICGGDLYVCDTGRSTAGFIEPCVDAAALLARLRAENHRVSVFALKGFALRGHLRPPRSRFPYWEPYAVAFDSRRRIFVTDAANGVVHRFDAGGRWEDAMPGFASPTFIAIDRRDRLYVMVGAPAPAVQIVDGLGITTADPKLDPTTLTPVFPPLPFGVEATGAINLSARCPAPGGGGASSPGFGRFDAHGDPLDALAPLPAAPQFNPSGVYTSLPLDSGIYRCQWHRVTLHAAFSAGTQVIVRTFSADEPYTEMQLADLADWQTGQTARGPLHRAWDCLIRSTPGRYLWLQLEFRSNGAETPRLHAIEVEFPRIGSRRYLPAVFGAEPTSADFTERFLSLFDTTLAGIEHTIDTEARFFDPASAPAGGGRTSRDFLSWLGGWIGISFDRNWDIAKRRRFLKNIGALFDRRGTLEGLRRQLLMLLEFDRIRPCCDDAEPAVTCRCVPDNCAPKAKAKRWEAPPLVLEHFRLRRWLQVGRGRLGSEAMLWGASIVNRSQLDEHAVVGTSRLLTEPDPLHDPFLVYAFQFTVFVPARYRVSDRDRKALENLLRSESPAHTRFHLRFVEPRFRIGVQSTIGFDTVVGRIPQGVTLGEGALGKGTVLTSPPHLQGGPAIALGKDGRIGTTTQLS